MQKLANEKLEKEKLCKNKLDSINMCTYWANNNDLFKLCDIHLKREQYDICIAHIKQFEYSKFIREMIPQFESDYKLYKYQLTMGISYIPILKMDIVDDRLNELYPIKQLNMIKNELKDIRSQYEINI